MPRLIRRAPLHQQIISALNPVELFFRVSEIVDSHDWDAFTREWGKIAGFALNLVFIIARANSGSSLEDVDIFSDSANSRLSSGVAWMSSLLVFALGGFSIFNAAYTFASKRRYRMFEVPLDKNLSTSSAQKVPANSEPISSPFQALVNAVSTPLSKRALLKRTSRKAPQVWELAIWDPPVFSLFMFCTFSPGHVLLYALLLPVSPSDPRPSITVAKAAFFGLLLTLQLVFLHSNYAQQSQDMKILSNAVANEYDVKFVRPNIYRPRRDAAVQTNLLTEQIARDRKVPDVEFFNTSPFQKFRARPNPVYSSLLSQESASASGSGWLQSPSAGRSASVRTSGVGATADETPSKVRSSSSINQLRGSASVYNTPLRGPTMTPRKSHGDGEGGSLGVYSHAASPLRKSRSSLAGSQAARR